MSCWKGLGSGEGGYSGQTDTQLISSLFGVWIDEGITGEMGKVAFGLTGNSLGACECSELCWGGCTHPCFACKHSYCN